MYISKRKPIGYKNVRVAIFHLAFIYSGGGEKLVLQQYDELKKIGFDVSIYTTVIDKNKSFPDIIGKYKINTFLPKIKIFKNHEVLQTVLTCILAPFLAYKFKDIDVVLACNQPSPWIAYVVNQIFKVPYISYLAQPTRFLHPRKIDKKTGLFFAKHVSESISARLMINNFRKFSNWADKISIKKSSAVMVNGGYMTKIINKIYSVKGLNCPAGVKNVFGSKIKKKNTILVTNRHFAQKRIEYAIFAFNYIVQKYPNYRLIITGSKTDYTHLLEKLVNDLGIQKKVEFLGLVSEKKLNSLYKSSKIYLYTAPEEDFGMGIIESMSFGTPVVAWRAKGPSKIITNDFDGLLSKPYDIHDFTKKIEMLITDKGKYRLLSNNAKATVKNKYLLKNHIKMIIDKIIDLVEG